MKISAVFYVFLGGILGVGISCGYANSRTASGGASSCDDRRLSEIAFYLKADSRLTRRLNEAVAGSAEAALDLAVMFGKIDHERMMCLERMAAENGGKVSQETYGRFLLESKDELVRARGKYWLGQSKSKVHSH